MDDELLQTVRQSFERHRFGADLYPNFNPDIPYISYSRVKEPVGVHPPGFDRTKKVRNPDGTYRTEHTGPQTYDWRHSSGSPENTAGITPENHVIPLSEALSRRFHADDAMGARYVLFDTARNVPLIRHPRITKGSLLWLRDEGFDVRFRTIWSDVDNIAHAKNTQADIDQYLEMVKHPVLATAGTYLTNAGYRIVQPLDRWYPIEVSEEMSALARKLYEEAGIRIDRSTNDWTRYFRLPFVYRSDAIKEDDKIVGYHRYHTETEVLTERMVEIPGEQYFMSAQQSSLDLSSVGNVDQSEASEESRPASGAELIERKVRAVRDSERKKKREPRRTSQVVYTHEIPDWYDTTIDLVARTLASNWENLREWHDMYLFIAGYLLDRNITIEFVPEIVERIARRSEQLAGSRESWADEHRQSATDTADKYAAGEEKLGAGGKLRKGWPEVWLVIDGAVTRGEDRRIYEDDSKNKTFHSVPDAEKELEHIIMSAGESDDITFVAAPPGLGKTEQAIRAAKKRLAFVDPTRSRQLGVKTAIAHDKNNVAIQTAQKFAELEIPIKRFRSSLSIINPETNKPECRYYEKAVHIQQGGQSVHWHFCDGEKRYPCQHRPPEGECKAYGQYDGEKDALVAVGNHALLHQLDAFVGSTGLLVIDEIPEMLRTIEFGPADFEAVEEAKEFFPSRYAGAMRAVLETMKIFLAEAPLSTNDALNARNFVDAVIDFGDKVSPEIILDSRASAGLPAETSALEVIFEAAENALPDDHRGSAPPLRQAALQRMRADVRVAQLIGKASRVYKSFFDAVAQKSDHALRSVLRVDERVRRANGYGKRPIRERVLLVTTANEQLVEAFRRKGPTVVLDADVDVMLPVIKGMMSRPGAPFDAKEKTLYGKDQTRIDRFWARLPQSTRRGWLNEREPSIPIVEDALERVIAWIRRPPYHKGTPPPKIVCLITFMPVAVVIKATLDHLGISRRSSDPKNQIVEPLPRDVWQRMGLGQQSLDAAVERLAPLFRDAGVTEWRIAHYRGLRGQNHLQEADVFITMGDPFPNLAQVRAEIAFAGLQETVRQRAEQLCAAELGQAQERSRSVRRETYARCLHVGRVRPATHAWRSPEVFDFKRLRPAKFDREMPGHVMRDQREAAGLKQPQMAEELVISLRLLQSWESGEKPIPQPKIVKFKEIIEKYTTVE